MNINATLIVEMLTFLVFVWFTMAVIWPPVIRALEKRRTQIAEGIASADQGRQALDLATKEGEKILAKAREQAAHQELDVQIKAAKRELYNEIAGLALKAAGQVVMEDLDDEKHHKMVNSLVKSWS